MSRKVTRIEIDSGCVSISYDNGDFLVSRINMERLAELIDSNLDVITASQDEIVSDWEGYDEYLDEVFQNDI